MAIMYARSPLNRAQREMMAVVVSAANNCDYCQIHHKAALQHYWKDEERVNKIAEEYKDLGLNEGDLALCDLASLLTRDLLPN